MTKLMKIGMKVKEYVKPWSTHGPVNWLGVSVLVIAVDQLTKYWIAESFELFDSIALIPHLNFTLLHNTGAAFNFLADAGGWQRWFFIALGIGVSAGIMIWLRRLPADQGRLLPLSLSLILGGALGNIIDRAVHGYVIDFIDFYYGSWHFPAFNAADSAITIGAALFILDSVLETRRVAGKKERDND